MAHRRLIAGMSVLALAVGATGATMAQGAAAPSKTTIKSKTKLVVKVNRYIQDGLRWDKDAYTVTSGGTLHIVNGDGREGPHTFTVVAKKDLPKTAAQVVQLQDLQQARRGPRRRPRTATRRRSSRSWRTASARTRPRAWTVPATPGVTGQGKKGESSTSR